MPKVRMLDVKNRRVIDPALELARKDAVILELQEAAEFEARVAAKLADTFFFELAPADVRMMLARLQVEEEMDG